MKRAKPTQKSIKLRGQNAKTKSAKTLTPAPTNKKRTLEQPSGLASLIEATTKLWRKYRLSYDQSKYVVEQVRDNLHLEAPRERRRTIERLGHKEIETLIEAAYQHSNRYGLMVKTLFYTGARVSEFVNIEMKDLHFNLNPPQIYLAEAKGGSDGYVPILPSLAQELRTHLDGRARGYLFESNRYSKYTPRSVQLIVKDAASKAGIEKRVTPHRLRASVATLLLDAGMPLDQVQKFLRHKRITTTQIYAETSLRGMGENYLKALGVTKS